MWDCRSRRLMTALRFPAGEGRDALKPPSGISKRILFVEDHEATRVSLARLLVRRGYAVESADSLRAALEIADGSPLTSWCPTSGCPMAMDACFSAN